MISYDESIEKLEALELKSSAVEKLFLSAALGRILAEDIIAGENSPVYPTSAMDGYAILASDQESGKIKVQSQDNPAGAEVIGTVIEGLCIKTFTGSLMPEGADTLTPIENVTFDEGHIIINEKVPQGFAVRPVGESFKEGEVLIKKGSKLGYAEIGVMASLNVVMAPVFIKPRVAVLSTGSEILDLGEASSHASQIRSSNNYTLAALAEQAGATVVQLGIVKDDKKSITQGFLNALDSADLIVTTGGVSVGDYDFVKDIIPSLGAEVIYKGVKIKPGQHIMLAKKDDKLIIALPGFAYSSTVTFMLYVIPLIHRMLEQKASLPMVEATLTQAFIKRAKKTEFSPCNLKFKHGRYEVDFDGKKVGTSAILTNMLGNCSLVVTSENSTSLEVGDKVKVINLLSL
ncbi:MAG: molybdopterin molybdenumtransferase MoeA [Arcobacter sp.]|nr:MAG: molybdopterin molybdenumtransferase MoeA [Arcobacter sp.]